MNSQRQGRTADVQQLAADGANRLVRSVAGDSPTVQVRSGVDVQSIATFREFDAEVAAGIKDRAFTDGERAYCEGTGDPPQHYAVRWAAKEAFVKLLAGDRSVPFDEVAVARNGSRPTLELGDQARAALDRSFERPPASLDVSLSHDRDADVAMAQVVAVAGGDSQ